MNSDSVDAQLRGWTKAGPDRPEENAIGPDEPLGSVYFSRHVPMGVAALLDFVLAGNHSETAQDESNASYEGAGAARRKPESTVPSQSIRFIT